MVAMAYSVLQQQPTCAHARTSSTRQVLFSDSGTLLLLATVLLRPRPPRALSFFLQACFGLGRRVSPSDLIRARLARGRGHSDDTEAHTSTM